jgi:hypothetical protein
MLKSTLLLLSGIIIGQEYKSLPNVKTELVRYYNSFVQSDFYKQLKNDLNKP